MFLTEKQGTVDIINCGAPLTRDHVAEFNSAVTHCLRGQPKIVLDLGKVAVVDSSGLETLLDLQEELELIGGAVKLASPGRVVEDALRATGIGERFEIFTTAKSAIGSFAR